MGRCWLPDRFPLSMTGDEVCTASPGIDYRELGAAQNQTAFGAGLLHNSSFPLFMKINCVLGTYLPIMRGRKLLQSIQHLEQVLLPPCLKPCT
ncbi:unnamed protein product [Caretta caretta]